MTGPESPSRHICEHGAWPAPPCWRKERSAECSHYLRLSKQRPNWEPNWVIPKTPKTFLIFLQNTSKDPRSETLIYCCNLLELLNFGSPLGGQALEKWVPISFPGCGHSAINQVETSDAIAKASTGAPVKLAARWHWVSLDPIRRHLSRSLIESIVTPMTVVSSCFLFVNVSGKSMATDWCFKCPQISIFHQVLWYSATVSRWCRTSPAPKLEAVSANFSKASPKKSHNLCLYICAYLYIFPLYNQYSQEFIGFPWI